MTAFGMEPSNRVFAYVHHDLGHVDMQAPESIMMRTPASPDTFSTVITSPMQLIDSASSASCNDMTTRHVDARWP